MKFGATHRFRAARTCVFADLGPRQKAILLGLLAGKRTCNIARDLGISDSACYSYRMRAFERLGIEARAHDLSPLFEYARKHGITAGAGA